ncbi:hypothetical protein OCOJLMKI_5314 [Methylobacterium iners]|uniref:Uncharacterized protein n=1 Tax=Methylobacterium iners TaxID=418707 RepID=A0ABQ4S4L6_9HYPH|nr:hypothetical protein OCOJLMKI_5314 [Methylobacterium iners]
MCDLLREDEQSVGFPKARLVLFQVLCLVCDDRFMLLTRRNLVTMLGICRVKPQLGHDDRGEILKLSALSLRESSRTRIDHAQGADPNAGAEDEWRTGIEANARCAGHQRILREARIPRRILDDHDGIREHRVAAERDVASGPINRQAALGLEPLRILLDQRDQGDGQIEQDCRSPADCIEVRLRRRTNDL